MRKILGPDNFKSIRCMYDKHYLIGLQPTFQHFVLVWLLHNIFLFYIYIRAIRSIYAYFKICLLKYTLHFMIGILSDNVFNRNLLQAPRNEKYIYRQHGNRLIPLTF